MHGGSDRPNPSAAREQAHPRALRLPLGTSAVVALLFMHGGGGRFASGYFPPVDLPQLAGTVSVALVGGILGLATRIPAGVLLGPLALGAVLNVLGWVRIELPPIVLIASYALIGWNTGLRFTRDVLAAAARALSVLNSRSWQLCSPTSEFDPNWTSSELRWCRIR